MAVLLAIVAFLWLSPSDESSPQQMTEQHSVDSTWLNLKYEIDKQYTSLYITYADSLSHMPEKTMNAAMYKLSGYANELLKEHRVLIEKYPQYEVSLQEIYLAHLIRDHNRLSKICEDYPIIYSNANKTE